MVGKWFSNHIWRLLPLREFGKRDGGLLDLTSGYYNVLVSLEAFLFFWQVEQCSSPVLKWLTSLDEKLMMRADEKNDPIFLILYSANLHDLTVVEKLSWSSNNILSFLSTDKSAGITRLSCWWHSTQGEISHDAISHSFLPNPLASNFESLDLLYQPFVCKS